MKSLTLFCAAIVLLSGCATGTHIVTGKKRTPVAVDQVTLYQVPPEKFDIVGIVNATIHGNRQTQMNAAVEELKRQAAEIGANGVIIRGVNPGGSSVGVATGSGFAGGTGFNGTSVRVSSRGIQLGGQAIYVSP